MNYIPSQGDIVWINLNPQSGHEQMGRRPGLVASNYDFNKLTRLAVICPITSTNNGFPLHVELYKGETKGYIMVEHVKSLDYSARCVEFVEKVEKSVLIEVLSRLKACF